MKQGSLMIIDARDDVAVALCDIVAGTTAGVSGGDDLVAVTDVAAGHKIALRALRAGDAIVKYGEVIGRATADIAAGEWVHIHNMGPDEP